jgi:hypothetical protein
MPVPEAACTPAPAEASIPVPEAACMRALAEVSMPGPVEAYTRARVVGCMRGRMADLTPSRPQSFTRVLGSIDGIFPRYRYRSGSAQA